MKPRYGSGRQQTGTTTQAAVPETAMKDLQVNLEVPPTALVSFNENLMGNVIAITRWINIFSDTPAMVQEVGGETRVLCMPWVHDREATVYAVP